MTEQIYQVLDSYGRDVTYNRSKGYGMLCQWHDKLPLDNPSEENGYYPTGCPECGHLIATITCHYCGDTFINYNHEGFDDVIAGIYITSFGDMACTYCKGFEDQETSAEDDFLMDEECYY